MEGSDKPKKYYTFTFGRYEAERLYRVKELYKKKLKFKLKIWGSAFLIIQALGLIYPIMMWFEYDINVFKPRMNEYLSNRFK